MHSFESNGSYSDYMPSCHHDFLVEIEAEKNSNGFIDVMSVECSNCKTNSLIESDLKINVTEAPYVCNICGEAFIDMNFYNRHKMLHVPIRKTRKCFYCKKPFTDNVKFDAHMFDHDARNLPYQCNICKIVFCSRESLSAHRQNEHNITRP